MNRVLVVRSDPRELNRLEKLLLDHANLQVTLAGSLDSAFEELRRGLPSLVVLGLPLDHTTGQDAVAALRSVEPKMPVVVLSAEGGTDETIQVIKAGAFDCLLEPVADRDLLDVIAQGLEAGRLMRSPVAISPRAAGGDGEAIIGRSKPIQEISKAVGRVAPTEATVLIRGASGTGKELVARAIYQHSTRLDGPFVVVNCVAIPETLLESELFGFERGAFTGAHQRRIGKVEQADRGTLFLDEIGDVPLPIQAKLLRLLEDRRIERIGGREPIPVDVRILAATNRDLEEAIAEGRFRSDLFYRLNVVPIHLPPLAERADDVPLLCDYYLERFALELGVRNPGLTDGAYAVLKAHPWPGNVRELANLMEQCLIFSRGQHVDAAMVQRLLQGGQEAAADPLQAVDQELDRAVRHALAEERADLLDAITERVVRRIIAEVLRHTDGNQTRAARLLGVSRPTLLARMRKLGLR
ncbi:MAG TPA: sigma-54 dependent transcriptional regulator [Methylomirabilota bacterium]|nr:sigma-54 dependent transcriptional regulator [Methylomirabilota bacterium]